MLKKRLFAVLTFVGLMLVFVFTACDNGNSGGGGSGGSHTVKYEITGPAITAEYVHYFNGSDYNMDQLSNVTLPWTKTITVKGSMIGVGCSFRTNYSDSNEYVAKIFVDGKEVASASTTTGHGSVTYVIN